MGIYIEGMKMPTHCTECDFWHDGVFEHCLLNMEIQNEDIPYNDGEYPDGCPLIFIPPHGQLIDMNSKTFPTPHRNPSNAYMKGWNACLRSVQQQPTVIPAELPKEEI